MEALRSSKSVDAPGRRGYFHRGCGNKLGRVAFILALVLACLCPAWAGPPQQKASLRNLEFRRVDVTILARGSSTISTTGNMDIYLAILSHGRHSEPVAARLVRYYPFVADGLPEEQMAAGHVFHMRLTYAPYCGMQAKAFVVRQAFDPDAIAKLQGASGEDILPCFIVRP